MQTTDSTRICWSTVLNHDPTPPSAFWPPLELPSTNSLNYDTAAPSKIVIGNRPRREAYVVSMQDQELLDHFKEERRSLRSLRRFLERGIGVDAIRASRVTSRRSSVRSVPEDPKNPSQRSFATALGSPAGLGEDQEEFNDVSLIDMLRASRVSTRSLAARPSNGASDVVAADDIGMPSQEEFPTDVGSRPQSVVIERRKGNWFTTRTTCLDIKLAVREHTKKFRRMLDKLCQLAHRTQKNKIKRKGGMSTYNGT